MYNATRMKPIECTLKVFQLFYRGLENAENRAPTLLVHGNANLAYLNKSYFTFLCKISALRERISGGGGGGGGVLSHFLHT